MKKIYKKTTASLLLIALAIISTLSSCADKKSQDVTPPPLPSLVITFDNGKKTEEACVKLQQVVRLNVICNNEKIKLDSTNIHWDIIGKSFLLNKKSKDDKQNSIGSSATFTCVDFGCTKVMVSVTIPGYAPEKLQADLHMDALQANSTNATQLSILQGTNNVISYTPGDRFLAIRHIVKDKDDAFPELTGPYQIDTHLKDYGKYTFKYVSNNYITVNEDKAGNNSLKIKDNAPIGKKITLSFEVTAPDGTRDVINNSNYYILPQKAKDINIADNKSSDIMKAALFVTCHHNILNVFTPEGGKDFGNFAYPKKVTGRLTFSSRSLYDFNKLEEVDNLTIDYSSRRNFDNGAQRSDNPVRLTHLSRINNTFTLLANEYYTTLNEQFDLSSLTYLGKLHMDISLSKNGTDPKINNRLIDYTKGFPKIDNTAWLDVLGFFNLRGLLYQNIILPPCKNVERFSLVLNDWVTPLEMRFEHVGYLSVMANGYANPKSTITFSYLLDMNVPSSKEQGFYIQANRPVSNKFAMFPKLTDVAGVSDKTKQFGFGDQEVTQDKGLFLRKIRTSLLKALTNQNIPNGNYSGLVEINSKLFFQMPIAESRKEFVEYLNNLR